MEQSGKRLGRIATLTLVLITVVVIMIVFACANVYSHIDDAYAQWGAADMVVDYMNDHNGNWPRDWTSLQTYFDKNNGRVSGWSFAEFQSHIYIDFTAESKLLSRLSCDSNSVPFNVIHATSFWAPKFGGGPNEMLYEYFRRGCEGRHREFLSNKT